MNKAEYQFVFKLFFSVLMGLMLTQSPSAATCDFAPVKKVIDSVTDSHTPMGQDYKQKVHEGWDSVKVLSDMSTPEMRQAIDVCRFEVSEYLTKLGFAPSH